MKLNEYCKRENITMKSIADHLGYSYNYFAHCANGTEKFSYKRAKEVSEFCEGEVTIDDLLPSLKVEKCPMCKRTFPRKKTSGQ